MRRHEVKEVFLEKRIRFLIALDLIKCLNQINQQRFPLTCAPISELLSNVSTVDLDLLFENLGSRQVIKELISKKYVNAMSSMRRCLFYAYVKLEIDVNKCVKVIKFAVLLSALVWFLLTQLIL